MSQANQFRMTAAQHRQVAAQIRRAPTLDPDRAERLARNHELIAVAIEARQAASR